MKKLSNRKKRYDRNIRLFGKKGQQILHKITTAVVGAGGLGTHVAQQLAYLGVGEILLIDNENLESTNLNRYVGTKSLDVGKPKVEILEQYIRSIDMEVETKAIISSLATNMAFKAIIEADYVFGCLDCEGARLILNELCLAYELPYFDLASEINPIPPPQYGGRVCYISDSSGCLYCMGELDVNEATQALQNNGQKDNVKAIYGIDIGAIDKKGPSVVSINGVIASLAITEFMSEATGLRKAHKLLKYYGNQGIVTKSKDEGIANCYFCNMIRGEKEAADVERYFQSPVC